MISIENRPLSYTDVVGQTVAKRMLKNLRASGEYPKALLFAGPSGIGKTTLVRIFTRSVFCGSVLEDGSPCNVCESCRQHIRDAHPNYIEVDAASCSGKEDMEALKQKLSFESEDIVVIHLDESQNITKGGKDALLKLLESLGRNNFMVIFSTTDIASMPETLQGRSTSFPVRAPTDLEIAQRLQTLCESKGFVYDVQALRDLASSSCGNVRLAEQNLFAVSLYGDISMESCRAVAVVDLAEISKGLCALGRDLSKSLDIFDGVLSSYGIRSTYRGILHLLVEAARFGASTTGYAATQPAKEIWGAMPKKVASLLDYMVTRNSLDDVYLFRTDLVVMHTRYLKGEVPDIDLTPAATGSVKGDAEPQKKLSDDPWTRMDETRVLLAKERQEKLKGGDGKLKLGPGLTSWPVETTNVKPNTLRRS